MADNNFVFCYTFSDAQVSGVEASFEDEMISLEKGIIPMYLHAFMLSLMRLFCPSFFVFFDVFASAPLAYIQI